jgi:hypothetical protein
MPAPTPVIKGVTTIGWAAAGANLLTAPAGAILESIDISPKNSGPLVEIENIDGAAVSLIYLSDGFDAKVTAVYDTNKVWPTEFANVNLHMPVMDPNGANVPTNKTFLTTLANNPLKFTRKKEAMIELTLNYRPGVHGAPA